VKQVAEDGIGSGENKKLTVNRQNEHVVWIHCLGITTDTVEKV
jgi:hypothetical protein